MKELQQKNDIYQIHFFTCPAHKPFHFAVHPWVVTVHDGKVTRWEVIHKKIEGKERYGYVYKNFYPPTQGIRKRPGSKEFWKAKRIASLSGGKGSLAEKMYTFIEEKSPHYPHREQYRLFPGPNSNTYIAWVLKHFPEAKVQLPWNAFGKNFIRLTA